MFLFTDIAQLTADSIRAADASTVIATLPRTASPQAFLSIITFTVGSIVDSQEAQAHESGGDFGSAWPLDHSAGSGPYMVDHWQQGTEVVLEANPNYVGDAPAVGAVLIKHVPESANQQAELERGDADIA